MDAGVWITSPWLTLPSDAAQKTWPKALMTRTVQVREGPGGDEGKPPDLSAERHIPLSDRWRSFLVYGYTRQNPQDTR